MSNQINIEAQIVAENTCQFTVDRPVYAGGSAYFGSPDAAQDSPLAQKIFELPHMTNVFISENIVKVSKVGFDLWRPLAMKIGGIIRAQLQSEVAAVSAEFQ